MKGKIIKNTVSLVLITLISALCLSFVFELTKDKIDDAELEERLASYREVFENAKGFKEIDLNAFLGDEESKNKPSVDYANYALDENGEQIGYVLSIKNKGYGGDIVLSLGISKDGTITGMKVTKMSESPGLGAHCKDEEFSDQFKNIKTDKIICVKDGKKSPDEIDAISQATVTSKAVTDAVNRGIDFVKEYSGFKPEVKTNE